MMPDLPPRRSPGRLVPVVLAILAGVLLAASVVAAVAVTGDDARPGRGAGTAAGTSSVPPSLPGDASPTVPEKVALPHVPPSQRGTLEELMTQVAEVRGLPWKEPLQLRLASQDEMVRRLRAANARETVPAQVAAEEATLKLLGLLPAELDLARLIDEILGSAVLGFYDPETKELYVAVGDANDLDAAEKATVVHEMTHALTDQHFAYGPRTIALDKADKADEGMAFSALIEGDARLTELQWMSRWLNEVEALAVMLGVGADADGGAEVLARIPRYVRRALVFPYEEGRTFVERLHSAGGFAAVDAAYQRPPTSTEQILHPEAYAAAERATVPLLPAVGATGCRTVRSGTLGEFDMAALLEEHAPGAAAAADGWDGDAYMVLRCETSLGLVDRWDAESAAEAGQLADALGLWARGWSGGSGPRADGRFNGPSGAGRIVRSGSRVDLVAAQDGGTAERLIRTLR